MVAGLQNNKMRRILIINFFAVLFIIFLLEIIFNFFKLSGLMGIQKEMIFKKDGILHLKPNKEGLIFDEKVFTDNYGYRVPFKNFRYNKDGGIFILGDSVAFGNGIKEEETFIGLLRKQNKNVNFINSSVPGRQIFDQIKIIKKAKTFKKVDKILYVFTLNDVYGSSNVVDLTERKKDESDYGLKKFKLLFEINAFLRNKSYLYMWIKGIGTDPSKRWFLNLFNIYRNVDFKNVEKQFALLKKISEDMKAELIVILLPYEYQTRSCSQNILKPQENIIKILNNLNIVSKNLTSYFCEQKKPNKNFYKFDPMHLSRHGHMLVFNNLKNEINF